MSKTTTTPYIQKVNNVDGVINNGTGTGKVTIFTAGADDAVLTSLGATSTETANDRVIQIWINVANASTDRLLGSVTVYRNAGFDGLANAQDLLHTALLQYLSCDAFGNRVLYLKAATVIKVSSTVAVTAGKEIDFIGDGGDF